MTDVASEKAQRAKQLLELKMPDVQEVGSAAMPVRWCLSPKLVKRLEEEGYTNPYLAIIVQREGDYERDGSDWTDTARYLVPLTREMQFVHFSRPGKNRLVAAVVNGPISSGFKKEFFSKSGRDFIEPFLTWKGRPHSSFANKAVIDPREVVEVEVSPELFAKEPPSWLKSLVGTFFRGKAEDQCHFRRRSIISLVLTPFYVIIGTLVKLVALALALFYGLRRPAIKQHLFHPLSGEWLGIWSDSDQKSRWFHEDSGGSYRRYWRWSPLNVYNPIVLLIPPTIAWGIMQFHHKVGSGDGRHSERILDWSWLRCVGYWWVIVVAVTAVVVIGFLLGSAIVAIVTQIISKFRDDPQMEERRKQRKKKREEQRRQVVVTRFDQLEQMTCGTRAMEVDLKALPKEKRTVLLRASAFKQRVCKPFAQ